MTQINSAYINKSIENLAIQIIIWQKMHFLMLAYSIFVRWTTIHFMWNTIWHSLREKCPNTEFFLNPFVGAFRLNIDRHEKYPNAGKYRPEQTPYLDTCILGHLVFGYFSHSDQKSKFKWNAYARKTDNTVSFFWHYRSVLYRWIY